MSTNDIKLSDSSIALIAKALQVALLTGTDVVDNLRLMRFELKDDMISPTEEYSESFDKNVNVMVQQAIDLMDKMEVEVEDEDDLEAIYTCPLDGADFEPEDYEEESKDEVDVDNW